MKENLKKFFKNKNVLITGGLGFLGSNLALRLDRFGCNITLADSMIPAYGGNLFNIEKIKDKVTVEYSDIRDQNSMNYIVRDKDLIFHFAGQVSHVESLVNPFPDIDINVTATTVLLEACKKYNSKALIIYSGTRGQYGKSTALPVTEQTPSHPIALHEITKLTAELIFKAYKSTAGIDSVLLRLTNLYGPRSQMKHSKYGVLNWMIRQALDNQTLHIFGDGKIIRDFLYIDDAIDAILLLTYYKKCRNEVFNIGLGTPVTIADVVKTIIKIAKKGRYKFTPYSKERKIQEPGNYYSDISKIKSYTKWSPKISLEEGIKKTVDFYKKYKKWYWQ